ncbi:MAG: hypothetical protein CR991_00035 [Proteobacteria bacterium]|nr:MAG: hypothetical protein CR991_00035 [Pseudomonadota bacterium]
MSISRRQFLFLVCTAALGSALGVNTLLQQAGAHDAPLYLYSASDNETGGHFLSQLNLHTGQLKQQALPFRGHALIPLAEQQVILFGRRPGTQCVVADFKQSQVNTFSAAAKRHFGGHGCLSKDRQVLFTTENDYEGKRGVLGIRDRQNLQVLGEYETYGMDPHDIHLMPDGKTLVIANGGIETHPDFGRRKLNISTMQPSLVYLDADNGKKLEEYRLPDHQLSIRHLNVSEQGDVGVALQFEGNLYHRQPASLVAWQPAGGTLQLLSIGGTDVPLFKGYMADLAFDSKQQILAVTSPRGKQVSFWNIAAQQFLYASTLPEPSGIAFLQDQQVFLVSDAKGGVHTIKATLEGAEVETLYQFEDQHWDNHLLA